MTKPYVVIDGVKYVPEFDATTLKDEILTISEVRPIYTMRSRFDGGAESEQTSLLLGFEGMPRTRFRPGMKIRIVAEK